MTVSYQYEVASSTSGGFTRLLFMWRGSLYKLIYRELLLFLLAFGALSALYRNILTSEQKRFFEKAVIYCDSFIQLIPLSFVLGFYVHYVADRWWNQYLAIPSPDKLMHVLALYVGSNDEEDRVLRRSLIRYLNLSLILILRSISSSVKRRFPTMDHLVETGFMTRTELEMLSAVPSTSLNTYWVPCTWFISLLKDAKNKNKIFDNQGLQLIMQEFNEFRSKCGLLWSYDWISIPLVYTQVVTVATYSFFIAALVGRQYVDEPKKELQMEIDTYFPVFTVLQFLFYMGLLKVAEQLINPFGDDDEDFELNWLIDRHTKVSYLGVDILLAKTPPLNKDKYFDETDVVLPYTVAAVPFKKRTHRGSTYKMKIPKSQQNMLLPHAIEEEKDSNNKGDTKTSFCNSNSLGVWRQTAGNTENNQVTDFKEPVTSIFVQAETNKKKFFKRAASIRVSSVRDKSFKILPMERWQRRSFNTTIDSYCSTKNIVSDSLFEISSETDIDDHGENVKKNQKRLFARSESVDNLLNGNILGKVGTIGCNNYSSSHCKGVSWKPVLKDLAGDTWNDNFSQGMGNKFVEVVEDNCIDQSINRDDNRQNTDTLLDKRDQATRSKGYGDICTTSTNSNISSPFATSLPNLHLKSSLCNSNNSTS